MSPLDASVSPAFLKDCTDFFGLKLPDAVEVIRNGFDCQTYKLVYPGENLYLSGTQTDQAKRQRQHAWVLYLQRQNFPVIQILHAANGETLYPTDNAVWYVMREAVGTLLSLHTPETALKLGAITGQLHKTSAYYPIKEPFTSSYPLDVLQHWKSLYRSATHLFTADEQQLIEDNFTLCQDFDVTDLEYFFVHKDLYLSNIVWDDQDIKALIDFNSADVGYRLDDFTIAFDCMVQGEHLNIPNATAFLKGYRQHHTLTLIDIPAILMFSRIDLLKIIACWCRDFPALEKTGKHPNQLLRYFACNAEKEAFLRDYL